MPKKAGVAIMAAGAVLIISALLLFLYNRNQDATAGQEAESLLESVEAVIEAQAARKPSPVPDASPSPTPIDPTMPTVTIDGYEYIGYVEVPVLELKLPVMAEWDYDRLKIAPCRQFGSTRTDDLVIAAHNFDSHFGRLKDLAAGETVLFTDMDGIVSTYSVTRIETLDPNSVEAVQNSGHDLVLYTCTKGGRTRVTVFCDRVPDSAGSASSPAPQA